MMTVIDNFDAISKCLRFKEDLGLETAGDWFYMIQIMTRTKDTGEKPHIYRTYFCESREYLLGHKEEIMTLCNLFNARAYIAVNPSSYKTCAIKMFKELADIVENESYKRILSLPETCAGKYTCGKEGKKWIVDCDSTRTPEEAQPFIDEILKAYNEGRGKANGEIVFMPTVNGSHLLVSPFDTREFNKKFPGVEIHKDNPTLLYYKKNED